MDFALDFLGALAFFLAGFPVLGSSSIAYGLVPCCMEESELLPEEVALELLLEEVGMELLPDPEFDPVAEPEVSTFSTINVASSTFFGLAR